MIPTLGRETVEVAEDGRTVWRDGALAEGAPGITAARRDEKFVTFEVGSGHYVFTL